MRPPPENGCAAGAGTPSGAVGGLEAGSFGRTDTTDRLLAQAVNGNGAAASYGAYHIKRSRRTKATITGIKQEIHDLLAEDHPQTVRQVYYAGVVRGLVQKTEGEYQRTIVRLLVEMRETGAIPFDWIADNTRWMRKPRTYIGLDACLRNTAKFYRRDLWAAMPVYCEIWCEKDALAGV